jgi:hypothetical protein
MTENLPNATQTADALEEAWGEIQSVFNDIKVDASNKATEADLSPAVLDALMQALKDIKIDMESAQAILGR